MARPAALLGLQKTSLREQAVDALRRAITTGELAPGAHVSEIDTAARLTISRATLREAMRELQQEGLLVAGSRGRLSVRDMDDHEVAGVFAVRGAIEALAAQTLTERADRAAAVAELRAAAEPLRARTPVDERIEADLAFHRTLCRLADNPTLLHTWASLEGAIRMSIMHAGVDRAARNMDATRHDTIVDAIESGDPDAAAAEVRTHMREAAETLVGRD